MRHLLPSEEVLVNKITKYSSDKLRKMLRNQKIHIKSLEWSQIQVGTSDITRIYQIMFELVHEIKDTRQQISDSSSLTISDLIPVFITQNFSNAYFEEPLLEKKETDKIISFIIPMTGKNLFHPYKFTSLLR